jgi:Domain of unknown function (DUF1843)
MAVNGGDDVRKEAEWGDAVPPYGPPMLDAVARGDLHEMKAVAAAARHSLFGVRFSKIESSEHAEEVRAALDKLEDAIRRLEP